MPDHVKVLWLIKGLDAGGAEKLLEMALPYLNRDIFEYQVAYLLTEKNGLVPRFEQAGVGAVCLDTNKPYDLRVIWKLRHLLQQEQVDILHIHSPYPAILGRLAGRLARVKAIIYTEHNIVERYHTLTMLGNVLTYPLSDAIIAISSAVRRSIERWKTARGKTLHTIYDAMDFDAIDAVEADPRVARKKLGINDNHLVVGNVAHIQPQKGHQYLVQAAQLVAEQCPDVTFVIVGGEKAKGGIKELEELAQRLGIRDRVIFTGFRHDVLQVIAGFDVFVLPSVWEGFGIVLLEAMALGKPVIGTSVGGIPEVIDDKVDGFLVEPRNPAQLAARIVELLRDEALRNSMGQKGMHKVRRKFAIQEMVRRVEQVYLSTINHRDKS